MNIRKYHLLTTVVASLLLVVITYAGAMWLMFHTARSSYDEGDYERAISRYNTLKSVTIIDRWRPYFGTGTTHLAAGDYDPAVSELNEALELVPQAEEHGGIKDPESYECLVRMNLYLAHAGLDQDEEAMTALDTCINPDPSATGGGEGDDDEGDGDDDGEDEGNGEDEDEKEGDGQGTGENGGRQDPQEKELDERNRQGREEMGRQSGNGDPKNYDDQGW